VALVGQYVDLIDGIVFSGGDDLDPALFGQAASPQGHPHRSRPAEV
jgi:gamma-glutamyl-gamma-aminobutyrate hydrolase PuuD